MLLAGDIGGTNTRLALLDPDRGHRDPVAEVTYASRDYGGPFQVITEFLSQSGLDATSAIIGVAGPVIRGGADITNLPWAIEAELLRIALGLESVKLVNDLEALAAAVPDLGPDDVVTISAGRPEPKGAMAVVAPGTGLGEGFLVWDGEGFRAHPSEGGHTDFAPRNQGEIGLLRYMQARLSRVSCERVCSGSGLPYIYDYLVSQGYEEPEWLRAELRLAGDPTPAIISAALDDSRPCRLCQATLRTFAAILGAEAGNLALSVLSTGGVFLGGGISRRVLPFLTDGQFLRAMRDKGRQAGLVTNMPVRVITCPEATLRGVSLMGLRDPGLML